MYNHAIQILLALGAIMIIFSGLQILDYFSEGKSKWPIRGVIFFYWALYLVGIYLTLNTSGSCHFKNLCGLSEIGGFTLVIFGYSAVAFYLLTVYSFTSLRRKMRRLNFSDRFTEKIRKQHSDAVIVFFFTTWVAAGFVYLIHHRAARIIRLAKKQSGELNHKELERQLDEVFGRKVSWKKSKKS